MNIGGTKRGEYERTAEHIMSICEEQGLFYAVAFLADAQYENKDLHEVVKIMQRRKIGLNKKGVL